MAGHAQDKRRDKRTRAVGGARSGQHQIRPRLPCPSHHAGGLIGKRLRTSADRHGGVIGRNGQRLEHGAYIRRHAVPIRHARNGSLRSQSSVQHPYFFEVGFYAEIESGYKNQKPHRPAVRGRGLQYVQPGERDRRGVHKEHRPKRYVYQ